MTRRTTRLAEVYKSELSRILSREKSLEGHLITVTDVEISPDLRQAFIYVSTLNKDLAPEDLLHKLNDLRANLQSNIAKRVVIKYTPRLNFRYDQTLVRGDRVIEIMNQLDSLVDEKPIDEKDNLKETQ
ncbi:MAG: 30S ribosome-binding factor RbfA [Verrucomicrobiota bacterium]